MPPRWGKGGAADIVATGTLRMGVASPFVKTTNRSLAQALLRWTLGFNLLGHGLNRIGHPQRFAEGMASDFAHTLLPRPVVLAFAFLLPFLEALLGALLLSGFFVRWALLAGALLVVAPWFTFCSSSASSTTA